MLSAFPFPLLKDDTLAAGPSSGALPLPGLDVEALDIALPTSEVLKLAPQTYEALDPTLLTHKSGKFLSIFSQILMLQTL